MNPKKVVRSLLPAGGIRIAEESYRKSRIYALQGRYGFPARKQRVIAVTGTNGKTTTCNYINAMLKAAGYTTAMFTTAVIEMAGKRTNNTIHRTVPLTAELLAFFKTAKAKKVDFVVLEVTSQALDQHKLVGIPVEIAVLTNLTQDHLDYHGTMERYAAAKARLINKYCHPKHVILNRDDDWYDFFANQAVGDVQSYGMHKNATLQLYDVATTSKGSKAQATYGAQKVTFAIETGLPGAFNLYNTAAAALTGLKLGIQPAVVARGVASLASVPGRMELIDEGQNFTVIVDYAHAPDALANVLKTLQATTRGRVHVVFGATGDRDTSKRPLMGAIAAQFADKIYLTDDETYTEDPASIRTSVMEGITKAKGAHKTVEIADRRGAIKAAFKAAAKGDVVLLAGLGHQDYRAMGGKKEPWDERDVARELLKKRQ
jgi:UDP-N-acetylmuramoyl-L-alanyl-D-glutamate--2,6-diaminopimelate ligase